MGFFVTGSAQVAYTNVVYPGTHEPNRFPVTWPLIVHSLLRRFITDDLHHNEHYAVTSAHIKQSEKEMDFDELLRDIARRCRNVFSNAEIVKCFKQGFSDSTRSLLEKNLRGIPASTRHDLDNVKKYALTGGTATIACQDPSVLTSTLLNPRQHNQVIHHIPEKLSRASFPTSPPTSLLVSAPPTPQGIYLTKVPRLQVT